MADAFSESYTEAREKFLAAAADLSAELHALEIAEDEFGKYTTDVAIVPGSGPGLVVISSGVHGVEGYAGSAVQMAVARQLKNEPVKCSVVLVHAVNPWGMAHFRRWNENNIDLNRNALLPRHFKQLANEDRLAETYMKFDAFFNPTQAPGKFELHVGNWFKMGAALSQHGSVAIKEAMVAATYTQARGIFFGGQELQPSHALLRDFMSNRFGRVRADDVTWIDVHTGLGGCGVDVLLGRAADAPEMNALFPAVPGHFDGFQGGLLDKTTDDMVAARCAPEAPATRRGHRKDSQSAGYESTVGGMHSAEWLNQFFAPNTGDVLAFGQEFGTLPGIQVARALVFENAGYQHDRANHNYWRTFTRDAFYVRTLDWKQRIVRRGQDVFNKASARAERHAAVTAQSRL